MVIVIDYGDDPDPDLGQAPVQNRETDRGPDRNHDPGPQIMPGLQPVAEEPRIRPLAWVPTYNRPSVAIKPRTVH